MYVQIKVRSVKASMWPPFGDDMLWVRIRIELNELFCILMQDNFERCHESLKIHQENMSV